jgi:hypothetical protein
VNRREFLLGGISSCVGILAGCSSLIGHNQPAESKPQLEVFVANALEESVRVTVTALRGSTEMFSHSYSLGAGKGDESKSFVGTPMSVEVSIQDGRTVTREYSVPPECESPELNITIEPDEILVTNGCVSS